MAPLFTRIAEFDTWRPGYGSAIVTVLVAGTTTPATIFSDPALTQSQDNPQQLLNLLVGAIQYGKFAQPFYTGLPYELQINSLDETGVVSPPLTTLVGQDATLATVIPSGGSVANTLASILSRRINVLDYGAFIAVGQPNASATTNTNTLAAAIGKAATNGGGAVEVSAGTFEINAVTLPANVVILGQGRSATTLQSTEAVTPVITVSGSLAGLHRICLDGLSQVTASVGLFAEIINQVILNDVVVKRFDVGIQLYGGNGNLWRDLYISDCEIGYQGHGYSDSAKGGPLEFCRWDGGVIDTCTTAGIELENIDELTDHHSFTGIEFNDNTGIALHIIGARASVVEKCSFTGNTTDLQVEDGSPINAAGTNTVIGLDIDDCAFVGDASPATAINLKNTLEHVAFRRCEFTNETITLTSPGNNVLEQDCRELPGVTFAGTPTAWIISKTYDKGKTIGLTTGNAATNAWGITLQSGQRAVLVAKAVGRCRNNVDDFFEIAYAYVRCSGATMNVVSDTAAFTAGDVVTGQTSGATARGVANSISGGAGTITLQDIDGTFQNGEIVTDAGGGSAAVSGAVTLGSAAVVASGVIVAATKTDSAWAVGWTASAQQIFAQVTGDTSMNVEWFVTVEVVSTEQVE